MWPTVGVFGGALIVGILVLLFAGNSEEKIRNRDAITKSAIFSHLTASLEGLISIRAFQCETRFIDLFKEKIDQNHKYTFAMMELKCWLAIIYILLTCPPIFFKRPLQPLILGFLNKRHYIYMYYFNIEN